MFCGLLVGRRFRLSKVVGHPPPKKTRCHMQQRRQMVHTSPKGLRGGLGGLCCVWWQFSCRWPDGYRQWYKVSSGSWARQAPWVTSWCSSRPPSCSLAMPGPPACKGSGTAGRCASPLHVGSTPLLVRQHTHLYLYIGSICFAMYLLCVAWGPQVHARGEEL